MSGRRRVALHVRTLNAQRFQRCPPTIGRRPSTARDAWGNAQSAVGNGQSAIGNRYLFQGREYSAATGLYNFRARWYDPQSGRWLSKDPIGLEGGLNLYAFCGDDAVNGRDPMGTDVNLNLNPRGSDQYSYASNYAPVNDLVFTVAGHGRDGTQVLDSNGSPISVEDLAQMIFHSSGYYPGEEVKLLVCYAGLDYAYLLAQALTRLTGVPTTVDGSSGPVWLSQDGTAFAAYTDGRNYPDGSPRPGAPAKWTPYTGGL